jgi:outer membrane immunogenic protein
MVSSPHNFALFHPTPSWGDLARKSFDGSHILQKVTPMKQLIRLIAVVFSCAALTITAFAGSETYSGKEMKQGPAPAPPPECNWTGFYVGIHGGGQFGHSEDRDLDAFDTRDPHTAWGYSESGGVAGGQLGYNWQWNWLVLGPEIDLGWMNLDGDGFSRFDRVIFHSDSPGSTDSDFYATFRGRLGVALGKWLFYGTGGGIGVNYETRVRASSPASGTFFDADKTEFDWGWAAGGGIEYMFTCHWTAKVEYLRFQLGDQDFSGVDITNGLRSRFTAIGTEGNIIRAGLNYKF